MRVHALRLETDPLSICTTCVAPTVTVVTRLQTNRVFCLAPSASSITATQVNFTARLVHVHRMQNDRNNFAIRSKKNRTFLCDARAVNVTSTANLLLLLPGNRVRVRSPARAVLQCEDHGERSSDERDASGWFSVRQSPFHSEPGQCARAESADNEMNKNRQTQMPKAGVLENETHTIRHNQLPKASVWKTKCT